MYVYNYCLFQRCLRLILLIRFNCKILKKSAISRGILQCAPNEQNQHVKELRKNVGIYIQDTVILKGLPSLDRKY